MSVGNSDALGRLRRSVLSFGVIEHTMKIRRLLVAVAVLCVAFIAYGTTRVRQPTASELSTVWVGWVDSLHYFRIQLSEDGTGLCGFYSRVISGSRLYEVTKWTLKGYDIELTLKPVDADAWPMTMKGTATPGSMHLKVSDGRKRGWRAEGTLEKESFVESAMESAKKRMQDHQKSGDTR
jgi:hypothetical protein